MERSSKITTLKALILGGIPGILEISEGIFARVPESSLRRVSAGIVGGIPRKIFGEFILRIHHDIPEEILG